MPESRASDVEDPSSVPPREPSVGVSDLIVFCGIALVVGGAFTFHPAAGAIALGAALVIFGARYNPHGRS